MDWLRGNLLALTEIAFVLLFLFAIGRRTGARRRAQQDTETQT